MRQIRVLALWQKTTANPIDEFIQTELKLDGIQADLIRLGIEKLLHKSPVKYKFRDWDSN
ncbi:hypothetical protein H6G96_31025 [Nostoc sp. FACHB-892]|uniref:hypothetical protein n=1 Tax=Nostoc sp. FACHB-892 TaxID=2692843 RepID=UPI001687A870|nr:hypothetical protein [Nostoc sp. FACHB-892]MBD2730632.1 hypothetical protein [Nostoc sp. FACHB-892]